MPLWSTTKAPTWPSTANGEKFDVFPSSEGWIIRRYKGPKSSNSRYWDELLATQAGILEASAANIVAVAFLSNNNYANLTITSGVGNGFSFVQTVNPGTQNIFQQSNSTTFTANATIHSTSNAVPYVQLAHSGNGAAYTNGSTLFQVSGGSNTATGVLFFANSTVLRVQNVVGTWATGNSTVNTVQQNTTVNSAVSAVTSNITGYLVLSRLAGRFGTANIVQSGSGNLTISAANNYGNGTVGVFFDERVTVANATPVMSITSSNTTNATATYSSSLSGSNTNRLVFTYVANGDANSVFSVIGQTITLNNATITDLTNTSVSANILFANGVVANTQFGVSGNTVIV